MAKAHNTHGKYQLESLKETDHLGDQDIHGIILKCILKNRLSVCTEFMSQDGQQW
jgi:hypothetical protein